MAGGMRSSLALGIGVVLGLSLLGLERMKAAETRTTVEGLDQRVHAAQITASQKSMVQSGTSKSRGKGNPSQPCLW
jgi:hypothetical protein